MKVTPDQTSGRLTGGPGTSSGLGSKSRPAEPARPEPGNFTPLVEPAIPEEDLGLLPVEYDMDRLYAVPRDPERVFATWEFRPRTRDLAATGKVRIRFSFSDGVNNSCYTDTVHPGMHWYYCAVPVGSLTFTVQIGTDESGQFQPFLSTGPTAVAIAFVRPGMAEFARLNMSDGPGARNGLVSAESPALPVGGGLPKPDGEVERKRLRIGYMPVSGRK